MWWSINPPEEDLLVPDSKIWGFAGWRWNNLTESAENVSPSSVLNHLKDNFTQILKKIQSFSTRPRANGESDEVLLFTEHFWQNNAAAFSDTNWRGRGLDFHTSTRASGIIQNSGRPEILNWILQDLIYTTDRGWRASALQKCFVDHETSPDFR